MTKTDKRIISIELFVLYILSISTYKNDIFIFSLIFVIALLILWSGQKILLFVQRNKKITLLCAVCIMLSLVYPYLPLNSIANIGSSQSISQSEAQVFMQDRCNSIGQTLMKTKTIDFNGTKLYAFLSVSENGMVCITTISENKLEVLAADCGEEQRKINEWNSL